MKNHVSEVLHLGSRLRAAAGLDTRYRAGHGGITSDKQKSPVAERTGFDILGPL